jgi:hypothetical protein
MGCLRRTIIVAMIALNMVAMGWMLLVLSLGGIWGDVVILSANDALVGAILLIVGMLGNILLGMLLRKGRRRKRGQFPADDLGISH